MVESVARDPESFVTILMSSPGPSLIVELKLYCCSVCNCCFDYNEGLLDKLGRMVGRQRFTLKVEKVGTTEVNYREFIFCLGVWEMEMSLLS